MSDSWKIFNVKSKNCSPRAIPTKLRLKLHKKANVSFVWDRYVGHFCAPVHVKRSLTPFVNNCVKLADPLSRTESRALFSAEATRFKLPRRSLLRAVRELRPRWRAAYLAAAARGHRTSVARTPPRWPARHTQSRPGSPRTPTTTRRQAAQCLRVVHRGR